MAQTPGGTAPGDFQPGPASTVKISLSQALLAPLDAILKAQLHSARSFLNLLFQLGYPEQDQVPTPGGPEGGPAGGSNRPVAAPDGKPFTMHFFHEVDRGDGRKLRQDIEIPVLALLPVAPPLAVQSAEFNLSFQVTDIEEHRQYQSDRRDIRRTGSDAPWSLVWRPVRFLGHVTSPSVTPPTEDGEGSEGIGTGAEPSAASSAINIQLKLGAMKMPAALDRLLTTLTQVSELSSEELPPAQGGKK